MSGDDSLPFRSSIGRRSKRDRHQAPRASATRRSRIACGRAFSTRSSDRTNSSARPAPCAGSRKSGALPSLILWGPPGCGKTTLARLLAGDPARADLRRALGRHRGRARRARRGRARRARASVRPPDRALPRRDPSLQPRPAGRPAAARGARHRDADRCHDRESVVRSGGAVALALPRLHAGAALARRDRRPARARARGSRARPRGVGVAGRGGCARRAGSGSRRGCAARTGIARSCRAARWRRRRRHEAARRRGRAARRREPLAPP